MKKNGWVRTLGLVLVAAVVLAACGGAGAGGDDSPPDLTGIELLPSLTTEATTALSSSDSAAGFIGITGYGGAQVAQAWLLLALAGWSESAPPTYSSGGYTVAWTESGNTWCWDIYDGATTETSETWYSVCVTDTGSNWSLEITDEIEDFTLIVGTISYDGSSGDVTYYNPAEATEFFQVVWGPGSTWVYDVTVTYFVSGVDQEYLTMSINETASEGSWAVYNSGGSLIDSGSWGS